MKCTDMINEADKMDNESRNKCRIRDRSFGLQGMDCEKDNYDSRNPEITCSKPRGRSHIKAEKKDSGIGSDRSVSPASREPSAEKSVEEAVSSGEELSDQKEKSKKSKPHPMLRRTSSVQWTVADSTFHTRILPATSCLSLKSNFSMCHPPGLSEASSGKDRGDFSEALLPDINTLSIKRDKSMEVTGNFQNWETPNTSACRVNEEIDSENDSFESMETLPGIKEDFTSSDSSASNHSDSEYPTKPLTEEVSILNKAKETLKGRYKEKLKYIFVKAEKHSNPILLQDVYIEPCITQEKEDEESLTHEMREPLATSNRVWLKAFPVKGNVFKHPPEQQKEIKTMLTKGIAGIGKSVYVQKFILDWAEEETDQEIDLILVLYLKDLNSKKKEHISLTDLLQHFFPELKQIDLKMLRIMLVFDGLDEYHLPLDFHHNVNWSDPTKPTTVDVLLTNLIKGNLLPSALLWITSRPKDVSAIPSEYIQKITEIHGFKDAQKEEYFYKTISDKTKASKIISHIKTSRNFYRMCYIPAYCSLSAAVLQDILDNTKAPQTLSQMLTCLLLDSLQSENHKD